MSKLAYLALCRSIQPLALLARGDRQPRPTNVSLIALARPTGDAAHADAGAVRECLRGLIHEWAQVA